MTDINKTPDNVEVSGGDINKTEPDKTLCPTCGGDGMGWNCPQCHGTGKAATAELPRYGDDLSMEGKAGESRRRDTAEQNVPNLSPEEEVELVDQINGTPYLNPTSPDEQSFEQIVAEALELLPENVAAILASHRQAIDRATGDRIYSYLGVHRDTMSPEVVKALQDIAVALKENHHD